MTLEQYAYLAEIVGGIIVVVTLLYLAVQVRQGAHLMRSESRQGTMAADVAMLSATFGSLDVMSLVVKDPAELTASEDLAVAAWCAAFVRIREFAWFQYKAGILDESTWRSYLGPVRRILGIPNLRKWVHQFAEEVDPEFLAYLHTEIDN